MNKKYKIYSRIGIVIAIAIFVLVNVFMSVLTKKMPIKLDLTSNKRYELSEESYAFLDKYTVDTVIYIIASETDEDKDVRAVIDRYSVANPKIKVENIDLDENPAFGLQYVQEGESLSENAVVVAAGNKSRVITKNELHVTENGVETGLDVESKITSALKYVSSDKQYKAYFTTGHGEDEFVGAKSVLESENYIVDDISLISSDIPEDTSVLVIPHPMRDFTTAEMAKIDRYVRSGGAVQVYVSWECPVLPNLNEYLEKSGITIRENIIAEKESNAIGENLFVVSYNKNDVTSSIIAENRFSAYRPFSKWIDYSAASGAVEVSEYLRAMNGAYTVSDLNNPVRDEIEHTTPPTVALMSENIENGGKIYVCGNKMLLNYDEAEINGYGLANMVYFAALTSEMCRDSAETFVVPVKETADNSLVMLSVVQNILFVIIVVLIPLAFTAGGLVVFFKRRNM